MAPYVLIQNMPCDLDPVQGSVRFDRGLRTSTIQDLSNHENRLETVVALKESIYLNDRPGGDIRDQIPDQFPDETTVSWFSHGVACIQRPFPGQRRMLQTRYHNKTQLAT